MKRFIFGVIILAGCSSSGAVDVNQQRVSYDAQCAAQLAQFGVSLKGHTTGEIINKIGDLATEGTLQDPAQVKACEKMFNNLNLDLQYFINKARAK